MFVKDAEGRPVPWGTQLYEELRETPCKNRRGRPRRIKLTLKEWLLALPPWERAREWNRQATTIARIRGSRFTILGSRDEMVQRENYALE